MSVDVKFRSFWRDVLAPTIALLCVLVILYFIASALFNGSKKAEAPSCAFCPVTLEALEVSPTTLRVGDSITLTDGVCNSFDRPLNAQIYLGAETVGTPSLATRTIDLLTRQVGTERVVATDTPEGRVRRTLEANACTVTEPISGPLPDSFSPGIWQLKAHLVVAGPEGQVQDLVRISEPFRVAP